MGCLGSNLCRLSRYNGPATHQTNVVVRVPRREHTLWDCHRCRRGIVQSLVGFHQSYILHYGQGIKSHLCALLGLAL